MPQTQITAQAIADLLLAALPELNKRTVSQIAQRLPKYEAWPKIFQSERRIIGSGTSVQQNLLAYRSSPARAVGLGEPSPASIPDLMSKININWSHYHTNWAFEIREQLMNKGEAQITDMLAKREFDARMSLIDRIELDFFGDPNPANARSLLPMKYWLVASQTTGFNGIHPSGYTSIAGVDAQNDVTNFRNWTDTYTTVSFNDLVDKLHTAHWETGWVAPINLAQARRDVQAYTIYCHYETYRELTKLGRSQNDNLGPDIAAMDGMIVFNRHPIVPVHQLTENGDKNLYMVNHEYFTAVFLEGDVMRRTGPRALEDPHNIIKTDYDLTVNTWCDDRRRQAVIAEKEA